MKSEVLLYIIYVVSLDPWFDKAKAHEVFSTTDFWQVCCILLGVKQRKLVIYLWQVIGTSPYGVQERLTKSRFHISILNNKLPSFSTPRKRKMSVRDIKTTERLGRPLSSFSVCIYLDAIPHYSHSLTKGKALRLLTDGYQHLITEPL